MCYLCEEYGDSNIGNGIWYFNPKNHARNMYKLLPPGEGHKGPESDIRYTSGVPSTGDLVRALEEGNMPERDRIVKEMHDDRIRRGMPNQVLTLEDSEKVMDLCSPIGLMYCGCRQFQRGIGERSEHEYTCMGMGVGMLKWERWPERYKGGVTFLNPEEGKEWLRKMNKMGFVHLLMLFGTPYIGGFCQCDYPDCNALRMRLDFGVASHALKGHEIAEIDADICNGCGVCIQRCHFDALHLEVKTPKAHIDPFKCFGCGLCKTRCPRKGAIKLVERKSLPALAEVW